MSWAPPRLRRPALGRAPPRVAPNLPHRPAPGERAMGNQARLRRLGGRDAPFAAAAAVNTLTSVVDAHEDGVVTETQSLDGGVGPGVGPGGGPGVGGGGPSSGCSITAASFAAIPSGAVAATLAGSRLGAAFTMLGDFTPAIPCTCSCGEYRQDVRGTFTANGHPVTHSLGGGRTLHPTRLQEDGDVAAGTVYGHRSVSGTKSKFTPDQAGGCRFEGADEPGISAGSGVTLAMDLAFEGRLVDTCRANATLASSAWTVKGAATVP